MSAYSEKLKDPRWQKKRLEILARDEWTCQQCGAKDKTLHVHHRLYLKRSNPWDYPEWLLQTLCEPCHADQPPDPQLVESILAAGGRPEDVEALAFLFQNILPVMSTEEWRVFEHHLTRLGFAMAHDLARLKAEHEKYVSANGFEARG